MPGPERGTRPFLPLVTFPMCLSGSSLCFGFTSCRYPSPRCPPTPTLVWNSSPSSQTFRILLSPALSLCSPQWCERNELCRRLQLRDLLVAPLQRLTRYPLLLRNMAKRCQMEEENKGLQTIAEQVDTSICELATPQLTPVLFQRTGQGRGR